MSTPTGGSDLPWHQRLEARVASALGLLVAVALGAVLFATLGVVSSQSRDRVAADLVVAQTAFHRLLALRLRAAIDVVAIAVDAPAFRDRVGDAAGDVASALAETQRGQLQAAFAVTSRADGTWTGAAGWADRSGSGLPVVRNAQSLALRGQATGALVQDADRLFLVVSVPVRDRDRVAGTFTAGYPLTDDI
ncbi:MAG: hypothetical protein IT181_14660, partial [Acidobacteria bacterium]|nr:hypothetical protein [Acidobacteriota bacterium]